MHLGVFVLGAGNHSAGWRWEGAAVSNNDLAVIQEIARVAERGKFDLLFVSDGLDYEKGDLPSFMCRFEPTSLISALSAHTTRLGLGATVSTSFTEPYNVARLFASIDHISQGRAAWNVVTSSRPKAALNFNFDRQMDHELRYQRAEEFVDVVKGLWDCWDDGALVADKASGVYIDDSRIRPLDHKGRFFQVKGPINIARCPQGHPVIIQAGGSPSGLELAARTADVVFSVVQELDSAKNAYADLKGRMAKYGRSPEQLLVLPGVMPIVGRQGGRGKGKARPAAELADPDQCPDSGDRPDWLRCQRLPARRPGTSAATFRRRPHLPPRALRHGPAAEHDPARPLQPYRRGARPLGHLRHPDRDRRHP
jgi:FMN-dependent oxidoreductase (nitrilotriacetate monooxygenase family)